MRFATIYINEKETAAIAIDEGLILINTLNEISGKNWSSNLLELIETGQIYELVQWFQQLPHEEIIRCNVLDETIVSFAPLYRRPRKIWGIGMNYLQHEPDRNETYSDPVSFMKPDTSIIGMNDTIRIPHGSTNTTAEAELGIVIGRKCSNISKEDAVHYILGYTTTLDMTEADIHNENQRYLTRAKSFDTFFSFGPYLMIDEVENVKDLVVTTVLNGEKAHQNVVSHMRYDLHEMIAFHSQVMTLLPGDIIITGTPGSVVIRNGDTVECHISGFVPLVNEVKG
ncbi:fumarylacetoacetate hydrolase [Alkalihalophilus pseudofirmus]|nr:fumarylacetoacetate hydrolase [Alkalihalophilus pseudofirmus]